MNKKKLYCYSKDEKRNAYVGKITGKYFGFVHIVSAFGKGFASSILINFCFQSVGLIFG